MSIRYSSYGEWPSIIRIYIIFNPIIIFSGYVLHHKHEDVDWEESHISGDQSSYLVPNLMCGSKYQFFLTGYNSAGKGDPSEILTVKTEGGGK